MPDSPTPKTVRRHDLAALDDAARARLMRRPEADVGRFLEPAREIVDAVAREGDAALVRFARDYDKAEVSEGALKATPDDFARARQNLDPKVRDAIAYAAEGIRRFHAAQKPAEMTWHEVRPGAWGGERWRPVPSVACYVPRGKGAFPSVVMMTTIPAVVAGVERIAVVTPPGPDGKIDAATLVAAEQAGVSEVYKCGGAQAVAAVAYGTETVPRCAKIVGPGSPWVVAAKRLLADRIDPGTPAGPSESVILADSSADGRLAGLDLVIESEHGPDSSAFLVTDSEAVAAAAAAAIPDYWARMGAERVGFSSTVLGGESGGIVLARDWADALAFTNAFAPEHLEILSAEPFADLGRIEHAGEVLLGRHTPIVLGNFVLGPNAVLPTGAMARTASPLSVFDYMKRTSVGYVTADGYPGLAGPAKVLAEYEGFDGHALALSEVRDDLGAGRGSGGQG
jgi:histidinol dehydrogenase